MQGKISIDSVQVNAPEKDQCYFLKNLSIFAGNVSNSQEKQIENPFSFPQWLCQRELFLPYSSSKYTEDIATVHSVITRSHKELPETNNDFQFNFQLEDTELFSKVFKSLLNYTCRLH